MGVLALTLLLFALPGFSLEAKTLVVSLPGQIDLAPLRDKYPSPPERRQALVAALKAFNARAVSRFKAGLPNLPLSEITPFGLRTPFD